MKRACLLLIGDELLSGRTQDVNLAHISKRLNAIGVHLAEARIIADLPEDIIHSINAVRKKFDYVLTTGGIGPTHDDITVECVAKAFGRKIIEHPKALSELRAYYEARNIKLNAPRRKMALIPEGAELIPNIVSAAPGFRIENLFVLAGVPRIMQVMLEEVLPLLEGGEEMLSRTITAMVAEGEIAETLDRLQKEHEGVGFGCYPFYEEEPEGVASVGAAIVMRSYSEDKLNAAHEGIHKALKNMSAKIVDNRK
ncbi:MAG: competence/damage-inducible protein A [Parvibaculales bacterium]